MTDTDAVRKQLDNHVWREKWRLMETLRFTWETLGDGVGFGDLIAMTVDKRDEMYEGGEFDHDRFRDPVNGIERQFTAALLAISKEVS